MIRSDAGRNRITATVACSGADGAWESTEPLGFPFVPLIANFREDQKAMSLR